MADVNSISAPSHVQFGVRVFSLVAIRPSKLSHISHHTQQHLGFIMAQKQIELQDLDLQQLVEVKKQLEDVRSHLLASVQDCAHGNSPELVRRRWHSSSLCLNKHADDVGEEGMMELNMNANVVRRQPIFHHLSSWAIHQTVESKEN